MADFSKLSRRGALSSGIGAAVGLSAAPLLGLLSGCGPAVPTPPGITKVYVLGTIHSNHIDSETYSLAVLEQAVRKAAPDIVLAEIPPDRIDQSIASFRETGVIDEPRTQVFPEYTDIIFPLSRDLGFEILGTAGWTRTIADDRRVVLERIQSDTSRADEWAQHRQAQRNFRAQLAERGDDPLFIHTPEFDQLVEISRDPYRRFFDVDLGPGGWTQINRAHTDLINASLDSISGKGLTALITFGTAHKYMIHRAIAGRRDIAVQDSAALFM